MSRRPVPLAIRPPTPTIDPWRQGPRRADTPRDDHGPSPSLRRLRGPLALTAILIGLAGSSPAAESARARQDYGPDPATVRRYGPAYRYPQAGWIVLHVEGEPYERGYQHGRLMAPEIADYLKTLAAKRSTSGPRRGVVRPTGRSSMPCSSADTIKSTSRK